MSIVWLAPLWLYFHIWEISQKLSYRLHNLHNGEEGISGTDPF